MKINTKVDKAVHNYANDIVNAIKQSKFDISVELDFSPAANITETEEASSAIIASDLGIVVVWPDFVAKSARAAIFKVGEAERLEKEGFDPDWIEENGKVYGALMPYTEDNVSILGYYLSHKINKND
jgi:hypothetical protein